MKTTHVATALLMCFAALLASCGGKSHPLDPCEGVDCSDHGTCRESGGSAVCECEEGFRAVGLVCVPVDVDTETDEADIPDTMEEEPITEAPAEEIEETGDDQEEIDIAEETEPTDVVEQPGEEGLDFTESLELVEDDEDIEVAVEIDAETDVPVDENAEDIPGEPDGPEAGTTVFISDSGGGTSQSGQYTVQGGLSALSCPVSSNGSYVIESCGIQLIKP